MDTLMLQANLGTFREREIDRKYLDALENYKRKKPDGNKNNRGFLQRMKISLFIVF